MSAINVWAVVVIFLYTGGLAATGISMENPCNPTGMTPYDYGQVLCMSYLFYEAQRSGPLPPDQRVSWRHDSAVFDGADVHQDLAGGYYDAGDFVKFGFPMAFTTTMLAWGLIDFAEGHSRAEQSEYGRAAVKWATDYFLKAHTSYFQLYGQVGDAYVDHDYWGRPEDMTMDRPSWKIDKSNPGSELAGETAAALAAAYIVFKDVDAFYANEMLDVAKELYDFADQRRDNYQNSIPNVEDFYKSWNGYGDELCWSALWLYRATGDRDYLTAARRHYDDFELAYWAWEMSWDDKTPGIYALFTLLDESTSEYRKNLKQYLESIRNDATYTPGGLVFINEWGSNGHAANIAFIALWAANQGIATSVNRDWAETQINYLLGSNDRSFVVGYGVNSPQRPHHASSSCPDLPQPCDADWALTQPGPNPQVLYGALVGGPDKDDNYEDNRNDYVHNEVACDYNSGFTGALAALVELH